MSRPKKQAKRRIVSTGIWLREITAPEMGPVTVENANALRDEILRDAASIGIPAAIREHAIHVLLAHGVEIESHGRAEFRYPNGWGARPRDDDDVPEVVRDAAELLFMLSLKPTVRVAFHIGMRYAIMLTRDVEPAALIGSKSLDGAKRGGLAKRIPDEVKRRQALEWKHKIRSSGLKTSLAISRLRIPKTTYYEYRKLLPK